ncbi:MAG TPA: hypothetical protein VN740_04775 [Solirubrobacteraceae bacterium]|nr:hypothetical protein [Solirubrobacteraceae bacterium]
MATRQLQTRHEPVTCEICRRSLLRGEHAANFRDGAETHTVCELCTRRALDVGWVREGSSVADALATRTVRARSLVGRLRARLEDTHSPAPERGAPGADAPERHVHAVPADQRGQLARAVMLFNASEQPRMLAGVIRSLGAPYVHVGPLHDEVVVEVLVAWELCWYRFDADLEGDIVHKRAQGYELTELGGELAEANAAADPDGRLALAV